MQVKHLMYDKSNHCSYKAAVVCESWLAQPCVGYAPVVASAGAACVGAWVCATVVGGSGVVGGSEGYKEMSLLYYMFLESIWRVSGRLSIYSVYTFHFSLNCHFPIFWWCVVRARVMGSYSIQSPPKESIHFCRTEYSKLRGPDEN